MARRSVWRLAFVLFAIFLILSPAVTVRADDDDDDEDATAAADDVAADAAASEMVATEEEEEAEEELPRLMPAAGVEVKSILPKFFGKEPLIHAGQEAELLFSISNNGPIPVFMGNVTGNIYVPFDFRYVVQNFSSDSYNVTIPPGVQTSFSFLFTPERYLQPRDFGLALAAFYIVGDSLHASLLINRTVEVLEPVGYVSGESIFLVLLAAGLLALFGVWAYSQIEKMNQKSRRTKKLETGTGGDSAAEANEWLQGTFFEQHNKQQVKSRKRQK
ncbi:hypothetical protein CLOM_g14280 [Closterium sp. NIES-68]|nr:hypothetical protein CLOM_g14280 [Closterium sp. NIES-68]GJP70969.1 hypothetical protein CLOP_g1862 [Closterium sp. NIES-67]